MFLQGLGSLPKWPVSAHSEHVFFNLVSRKSDPETVTLLLYIRNSPRLHRSDLFLILHIRSSSAGNTPLLGKLEECLSYKFPICVRFIYKSLGNL